MTIQTVSISGRLAQDAKVITLSSGRTLFKMSIPEDITANGATTTQWHSLAYFTGSDKEAEYLTRALVKGAVIAVEGNLRCEKMPHKEFPIDIAYWSIEANRVEVLHNPAPRQAEQNESRQAQAPAPAPSPCPDPNPEPTPPPAPAPQAPPQAPQAGSPFQF